MQFTSEMVTSDQLLSAIESGQLESGALINEDAIVLAINGFLFELIACAPSGRPVALSCDGGVVIKPSPGINGGIRIECPDTDDAEIIAEALESCLEFAWTDLKY